MRLTYFIFFLLLGNILQAQTMVFGKITDAEFIEALPYVNIGIPGAGIGTVSDEQGYYLLEIHPDKVNDSIYFSMVGFAFQSFKIDQIEGTKEKLLNVHFNQKQPL